MLLSRALLTTLLLAAPIALSGVTASSPGSDAVCVGGAVCIDAPDPCKLDRPVCPEPAPRNPCDGTTHKFSIILSTGADSAGNPTAVGTVDQRWTVPVWPLGSGPAYSLGQDPHPSAWVSGPSSAWINPLPPNQVALDLDGDGVPETVISYPQLVGPDGDYYYQTSFYIPANAYNVVLQGRFAADNSVVVSTTDAYSSTLLGSVSPNAFGLWTPFTHTITSQGVHTLQALVNNRDSSWGTDTKTGLNVEAVVTGICSYGPWGHGPVLGTKVCRDGATKFAINLNTGRPPIPDGSADTAWIVESYSTSSGSSGVAPAYVHRTGLPGAWVSDAASGWINPYQGTLYGPTSDTWYSVNYHIPINAYDVKLHIKWAADNSVQLADTDAWMSTLVGSTSPDAFTTWNSPTTNPIPLNVQGFHTLSASVHNRASSAGSDTQTGLNVVATVTGKCHPRPLPTVETPLPVDVL